MKPFALSVVMAAPRGLAESPPARRAFEAQLDPARGDELIVETDQTGSLLVPQLWTRGIEKSRGEVVALTLASMVPDAGWANAVRCSFEEPIAGVGGAIEPGADMRPLDWAIHLARYAGYLQPFEAREAEDLPGDNAAYRREAIDECSQIWADGFWETEVDSCLRASGRKLLLSPKMTVRQGRSLSFSRFCVNRFRHGMRSGLERGRRFSLAGRLLRTFAFPTAAAVMLARIRAVARSRGRALGFTRALPFLIPFLLVWTAGEAIGYWRGR